MKILLDFSLLYKNRNFGLLFVGQFVSFFGTMITAVVLPYQIYHLTQSTLMVGLLSLAQLLPLLVTALWGGVLADKYHRRRLLLIAETLLAIGCGCLIYNALLAAPKIWLIFVVASVMSAFNGLHRPALESITQQLVTKKDYSTIGALRTLKSSIGMIAGPAVAGLLIAYYGVVITYMIDFFTFLISLIALVLMTETPKPESKRDESTISAIKQGFHYAFSRQELVGTYAIDFIAMVFSMPMALFPAIAEVHGGAKTLGLLYAAPAVGAFIASFFSAWVTQIKRHGMAITIAASWWGVCIMGFGFATHFYLALFFLVVAGGFDAISGVFRMTMWNETIPTEYRGRLAGIEMLSYLSGPKLGDTQAGLMAAAFGVSTAIVLGGILCVMGVGICAFYMPKFWHYKSDS